MLQCVAVCCSHIMLRKGSREMHCHVLSLTIRERNAEHNVVPGVIVSVSSEQVEANGSGSKKSTGSHDFFWFRVAYREGPDQACGGPRRCKIHRHLDCNQLFRRCQADALHT